MEKNAIIKLIKSLNIKFINSVVSTELGITVLVIICLIIIIKSLIIFGIKYQKNKDNINTKKKYQNTFSRLKSAMNHKFFNHKFAPIIVLLSENRLHNMNSDIKFQTPNIEWILNERIAIVNIHNDVENILQVLQDVMDGSGFQSIILNIPYEKIQNDYKGKCIDIIKEYNQIINKTGIIAPFFITIQMDEINNAFDPYDSIGINLYDNNNDIRETISRYILKSKTTIELDFFAKIGVFSRFLNYCKDILSHYKLPLKGMYISSLNEQKELIYMETLLSIHAYNVCNEFKLKFHYYSTLSGIIASIRQVLSIAAIVLFPIFTIKNYSNYHNTNDFIIKMQAMEQNQNINNQELADFISKIEISPIMKGIFSIFGRQNINQKSLEIVRKYVDGNLQKIVARNYIKEYFSQSPQNTFLFDTTFNNIKKINSIHNSFYNYNTYKNTIINLFKNLWENNKNHILISSLNELSTSVNNLSKQNVNAFDEFLNIYKCCDNINTNTNSNNFFWNSNEYITLFENKVLETIPDKELAEQIIFMHRNKMVELDEFVRKENPIIGYIFNNDLSLSKDFIKFKECIDKIAQIPAVSTQQNFHNVLEHNKNEHIIWNINDITNIIRDWSIIKDILNKTSNEKYNQCLNNAMMYYKQPFFKRVISSCCAPATIDTSLEEKISNLNKIDTIIRQLIENEGINKYFIQGEISKNCSDIYTAINTYINTYTTIGQQGTQLNLNTDIIKLKSLAELLKQVIPACESYAQTIGIQIKDIINEIETETFMKNLQDTIATIHNTNEYLYEKDYRINATNIIQRKCQDKIMQFLMQHNKKEIINVISKYNNIVIEMNKNFKNFPIEIPVNNASIHTLIGIFQEYDLIKDKLQIPIFSKNNAINKQIQYLENLRNMFIIENGKLQIKIDVLCKINNNDNTIAIGENNNNAIKHYIIIEDKNSNSPKKYEDDAHSIIICDLDCKKDFTLQLNLESNSNIKFTPISLNDKISTIEANDKMYSYSIGSPFGIMRFINQHMSLDNYNSTQDSITLNINLDVTKDNKKDKLFTQLTFRNYYIQIAKLHKWSLVQGKDNISIKNIEE